MSSDDGIHVVETDAGYEVRHWMGESRGFTLGTFPKLEDAIKRGKEIGQTEYGFTFHFKDDEKPYSATDEIEIDIPGNGPTKCHALFVSPFQNMNFGDSMPFEIRIDGEPVDLPNAAYVIVSPA